MKRSPRVAPGIYGSFVGHEKFLLAIRAILIRPLIPRPPRPTRPAISLSLSLSLSRARALDDTSEG